MFSQQKEGMQLASIASWMDMPCPELTLLLACRAKLAAPFTHSPGEESLETAFFDPTTDLPFDQVGEWSEHPSWKADVHLTHTRVNLRDMRCKLC